MEENQEKKQKRAFAKSELVSLAFQLGFIIALPIVSFGYLGKWLDGKTDTSPLFTMFGMILAITTTSIWIYRKFNNYFK